MDSLLGTGPVADRFFYAPNIQFALFAQGRIAFRLPLRGGPLSPVMAPMSQDNVNRLSAKSSWKEWGRVALALGWLLWFQVIFFSQTLPNAQVMSDGNRPTRWLVWENVGTILLDDLLPIREPDAPPAGLRYLPQRAGFLLIAGFIYGMAYLTGTGLLHVFSAKIKEFGRLEWHALALAAGLSVISLLTLLLGLLGLLDRIVFLCAYGLIVLFWAWQHARAAGGVAAWKGRMKSWLLLKYYKWSQATFRIGSPRVWGSLIVAPFLVTLLLGAMLPSVDFDVKEYHFGGPKEYFLAGQIQFLPHNVYTSFPFLTEMLTLTGMVLYGDWYWGAVAGKTILCGFAPLTALLTGVLVRRWLGSTAGWLAAIIHLSIPWTYRISIIAYTEGGLSLYLAATLLAAAIAIEQVQRKKLSSASMLLCGFLAGSAAACKYPGLISVTIPLSLFLGAASLCAVRQGQRTPREFLLLAVLFLAGTLASFGPWLAKNLAETGNPVYPLLYSVFGGTDWDDSLNAKWKRGHSPDHHRLGHLWTSFVDVTTVNDWQSPLILGFGLLGFLGCYREVRALRWIGLYLAWLFITWWALTHRIDRFWVPLLPAASCLAACGAWWLMQRSRLALCATLAPTLVYNLAFITTALCGYNAYVIDLNAARQITAGITSPELVFLNEYKRNRPGTVLSVGEAELFDATFPYVYNTVFDRSLLAEWTGVVDRNRPEGEWELRETHALRDLFHKREITEILVNWQEILRYRTTYGYTDYVTPRRFDELRQRGFIGPPLENTPFLQDARSLSPGHRAEIDRWAPELIITRDGKEYFITTQIFPVLPGT